jgi:YegS/Rv2252/BmrU family lipid kinase
VGRQATIIFNPAARRAPKIEDVRAALSILPEWDISLHETEGPAHATVLATVAASRGTEVVFASGGDGTVNEVVNGIAGTRTALGVLPTGTANVWAKELGLPKRIDDALRLLRTGEVRVVDLGRAGDRFFLLMAGIGFDASIVRDISPAMKRRLGAASYVLSGVRRAFVHRAIDARMSANAADLSGGLYWLLASNTRSYGGLVNIAHRAVADDGALDVSLLRKGGPHRLAWLLPAVLLKRLEGRANVVVQRARSLEITTAGLPVQVDGEYIGETPMRFEVALGALRALVPRGVAGVLGKPSSAID